MKTTIARVLGTLRALVGRSEWPHPYLCFHHGGSEACEESNRRYGFECPRCHGEQDCKHCAHGHKDEDDPPCCYCTGAHPKWEPKAEQCAMRQKGADVEFDLEQAIEAAEKTRKELE